MTTFAHAERERLADDALRLGADAPTLCFPWTVKDLVVHLLVRERNPIAQAGMFAPPLAFVTRRATRRWERADLPLLVDQLRRPTLTWARITPLDVAANTIELFVHHEDIRRAQPEWAPRELADADQDALWRFLRPVATMANRHVPAPLVARDVRTGKQMRIRGGDGPAVVSGLPSELALFLLGRDEVTGVEVDGPDLAVRRLRTARRGL